MKLNTLTIVVLGSMLTLGCSNGAETEKGEVVQIELNEGQKWKVNSEMSPHVLAGEKILNEFDGSDYQGLAERMGDKNSELINSCTMDGKSHDELHKWLHPHMQLIDALSEAENMQQANEIIVQLKASYVIYHTHFD